MAALWFCLTLFAETAPGRAGAAGAEVVESATGKLTAADRAAIVTYLRSLPPIRTEPPAAKRK